MIDPKTAYVGMKVVVRHDVAVSLPRGREGEIAEIRNNLYRMKHSDLLYKADELDPIDPTAPKRVEVVTETRTVVKEVVLRLPVDIAKQIASVCGLPGWDEYSKQIHAALAAQEAK